MRLRQKIAVVTGASSGIGQAAAIRFAEEGADVVLVDLAPATETMEAIHGLKRRSLFVQTDVSSEADVVCASRKIQSNFPGVHVLFNNAGFMTSASVEDETVEQWDRIHDVNLKGMFLMCKHVVPLMRAVGGGSIINTASVTAILGHPRLVAYSATKGGILAFTKGLARDLSHEGIRVNSISPGTIETPLLTRFLDQSPNPDEARRKFVDLHLLGRLGTPRDIANVALFLATEESAFITGANIVADGGMTIKGEQPL